MSAPTGARPRWPPAGGSSAGLGERVAVVGGGMLLLASLLVWCWGGLASSTTSGQWVAPDASEVPALLGALPHHLGDPRQAWPPPMRGALPGPVGFYAAGLLLLAICACIAVVLRRVHPRVRNAFAVSERQNRAAWARPGELGSLRVRSTQRGRVTLGRAGGALLAAEPRQSVIVLAPTQSLKTTGLAIPAILEWDGPVLATSVKSDLLRDTLARRRELGEVLLYDPTRSTGIPGCGWTPLTGCASWQGAQRTAAWLAAAARTSHGSLADADFWYAAAAKLLAPLLLAARLENASMSEVVRWVDTQEVEEVRDALERAGASDALVAAGATWQRDERQRSSIYTTAETVLAAYADPGVLASAETSELTPQRLLDGGAHTAYLCAPAHEQQRLRPLFATLVQGITAAVYERAAATGKPLDPPLLIVLDEAASIAPLRDLDTLAATGAGQGIQLVTVFQDLAQVRERWGERASTILNNHRAKLVGAGTSDPATLDYLARVLGDEEIAQVSHTAGREGNASTTESTTWRALAPPAAIRQAQPGSAILVYGSLPPARVALRPWFRDRGLRRLACGGAG